MTLTPEQFNKLVTKEDLKEDLKKIASNDELTAVKNEILTAIDGIAKKHQDFEDELAANLGAHDRFEEKFTKTDKRIKVMEAKFEASPAAA